MGFISYLQKNHNCFSKPQVNKLSPADTKGQHFAGVHNLGGKLQQYRFFFSLFETRALLQKPVLGFLAGVQEEEAERRGERERVSLGV